MECKSEKYSFKKAEHLCSKIQINRLFAEGKHFVVFPYKVVYFSDLELHTPPVKAMFSVPKRNFKLAVSRNLLKRRSKEAYRLSKIGLIKACKEKNVQLQLAFLYIGKQQCSYIKIEKSIQKAVEKLETIILDME